MNTIISIGLLIIILTITHGLYKTVYRINALYSIIWLTGICLIEFNYAGIESLSTGYVFYIYSSVIVFNIVYFILSPKIKLKRTEIDLTTRTLKKFYIINILCYIYILPITFKALKIITTEGFSDLRSYAFNDTAGMINNLSARICSWIILPVFLVTMIVSAYYLVIKKRSIIVWIGIFDVLLYTFTFGGRSLIVRYLLYVLIAYLLQFGNFKSIIKKLTYKQKMFFVIASILFLYLLSLRSWDGLSLFENIAIYLFGSLKFCDLLMLKTPVYTYGCGMLGLFFNPIMYLSNNIFGTHFVLSESVIQNITDPFINIGVSKFNALPTSLFVYWNDFGFFGIILGTLLLVLLVVYAEKKYKNTSLFNTIFMIFIIYVVFQTTSDLGIYKISHFSTLLIMCILCKQKRGIEL